MCKNGGVPLDLVTRQGFLEEVTWEMSYDKNELPREDLGQRKSEDPNVQTSLAHAGTGKKDGWTS